IAKPTVRNALTTHAELEAQLAVACAQRDAWRELVEHCWRLVDADHADCARAQSRVPARQEKNDGTADRERYEREVRRRRASSASTRTTTWPSSPTTSDSRPVRSCCPGSCATKPGSLRSSPWWNRVFSRHRMSPGFMAVHRGRRPFADAILRERDRPLEDGRDRRREQLERLCRIGPFRAPEMGEQDHLAALVGNLPDGPYWSARARKASRKYPAITYLRSNSFAAAGANTLCRWSQDRNPIGPNTFRLSGYILVWAR